QARHRFADQSMRKHMVLEHAPIPQETGHACTGRHHNPDAAKGERTAQAALVPRTRSSHDFAATTVANFGSKSGTRIMNLLVSFRFRSSLRGRCKYLRTSESGSRA